MKKIILFSSIFFAGLVSAQETSNIKEIIKKATEGNKTAQLALGMAYDLGVDGLKQNFKEAIFWYTKAAEQGDDMAQLVLGDCYRKGKGIEQSYTKAVYWYTKAAEQGNPNAQGMLGACYYEGKGIEQSYSKAVYMVYKSG